MSVASASRTSVVAREIMNERGRARPARGVSRRLVSIPRIRRDGDAHFAAVRLPEFGRGRFVASQIVERHEVGEVTPEVKVV